MKKNKKVFIFLGIITIIVAIAIIIIINLTKDNNKLNILEKQWINNNNKMVFNVGVKSNVNIFENDGVGVFYDFLTDFSNEYSLTINPAVYSDDKSIEALNFRVTSDPTEKDLIFYQDHFALISKNNTTLQNINDLQNRKIGILASDLKIISNYLTNVNNLNFTQYDEKEKLITEYDKHENIDYLLVPLNEYLDLILEDDNYVNLHISDIPVYYTLYENGADEKLESIISKYYHNWMETNFKNHYNTEAFKFYTEHLKISEEQKDKLHNKTYNYGFIENNPYEALSGSNYGGIIGTYLERFKDFSTIDIKYTRYKNLSSLIKAINKKDIDLYFNYYNLTSDYENLKTPINISFNIIAPDDNNIVINSLNSLANKDVYALENSPIALYLSSLKNINVKTYKTKNELKRISKKGQIIAIDKNNFEYYRHNNIKHYTIRYTYDLDDTYNFNSNCSNTFNKLFTKFVNTIDPNTIINEGIYSNRLITQSGSIMGKIATYLLYIIFIGVVIGFIVYKQGKKIKIAKRIKKEDKIRFIDQLTSLKNRNYLNENIESWNKNTIYPQTTLIIDLNNIQYINDTYGYEEGDKQIKAAANILIKLQLDNSDIIRTDGTEFLVYLVGYSEKQIISFMRKLNKEFKKLPYDYGAVMGYSTINDDIKLIEDAINEATLSMKDKKQEKDTKGNEEKI